MHSHTLNKKALPLRGTVIILLFLFQYLIVLIIPVVSMIFIYDKSITTIEDELFKKNNLLIEKSVKSIDQSLLELNMVLFQLENNSKILNYKSIVPPLTGSNVIRSIELKNVLGNYGIINDLFYDYFIIFNNNNMVIGPSIISNNRQFYNSMINYENLGAENIYREIFLDYGYQDDFITFLPAANAFKSTPNISLITVVKPIKYLTYKNIGITIVFFLNNKAFQNRIGEINKNDDSQIFVLSAKNSELITSSLLTDAKSDFSEILNNTEFKALSAKSDQFIMDYRGEKLLITSAFSKDKMLKFISVQPIKGVLDNLSAIKNSIFVFFITSAFLSLLIISILFFTNGVPAKKLLNTISTSDVLPLIKTHGIFKVLLSVFSEITFKNTSLSKRVEDQKLLIQVSFFERLYNGNFLNSFELDAMVKSTNLEIYAKYYTTAIIYINNPKTTDYTKPLADIYSNNRKAIEKINIESKFSDNFYLHNLSENKIAVLIKGEADTLDEEKNKVNVIIQDLYNILREISDLNCYVYVGTTCTSILEVSFSMNTVNRCMNYGQALERKNRILFYENIVGIFSGHYYPREVESKLINSVLNADIQEASNIIENVYAQNTELRNLSTSMILLISHELCATLFRALDSGHFNMPKEIIFRLNDLINTIDHKSELESVKTAIIELYRDCCHIIGETSKGADFVDNIIGFLQTNYHLPDISLDTLTDMFNISQAHLSKLFKEKTGFTFYEYLEKTRMEVACKMLSETSFTIKEIGSAVGYLSSNTFCRAFKRYSAINAGKYREIYNQKKALGNT